MNFQAVLFDFDGIIVDTEWAIYQAWLGFFRSHGHDLPLELYTRCIGTDFNTWSPKLHLESLTQQSFDWDTIDAQRQVQIVNELANAQPMTGVVDTLEFLQSIALPCAVVSSSSHHWVDGWLNRLQLADFFQTTVCRGDAPKIKPSPDLYLEAARRIGLQPNQCLVIEDSLNGILAARAAGMTTWAIPNRVTQCLDFSLAEVKFDSMSHALAHLTQP